MDVSQMKLGKKLGRVVDPRTLQFRAFMPAGTLPAPPKRQEFSKGVDFPMFANDRYGDCTCAAQAHRIVLQERNARQREIAVEDFDVVDAYAAVTGQDPRRGGRDEGAYLLDVLNYMRHVGLGRERDGTRHTIAAFVEVRRTQEEVRLAHWLFGGLYLGLWLPRSAQAQVGEFWDVPDGGPIGDGQPGSWGGHAVTTVGYNAKGPVCITWGERQQMTWAFFHAYADEAYAIVSEDFLRADGETTRGFNVEELEHVLDELGY